MRKLLVFGALLLLPGCGDNGGSTPTPVTQAPAPPVTQPPTPPPPQFANVTGSWDSSARRWHFRLQQSGSTVTGQLLGYANVYYPNPNHGDLAIRGTVTSAGVITFGCNSDGVYFEGRIESSTRMTGLVYDCVNGCRSYGDILVKTAN